MYQSIYEWNDVWNLLKDNMIWRGDSGERGLQEHMTKSRGRVEVGEGGGFGRGGVEGWGENADNCNWITIKVKLKKDNDIEGSNDDWSWVMGTWGLHYPIFCICSKFLIVTSFCNAFLWFFIRKTKIKL